MKNTTTLLFSLKRLEIVHQEGRGQVEMENLNGVLFHKSGRALTISIPINQLCTYKPAPCSGERFCAPHIEKVTELVDLA